MIRFLGGSVLAAAVVCLALPVEAAKMGVLPTNQTVLVITGELVKGDDAKFRALLEQHPVRQLYLDSKGGDYYAALEIALEVYMHGIATVAPVANQCTEGGDQVCMCASACVFVWAAGRPRFGNMVVVHASDPPDLKDADPVSRTNALAAIKAHMQDMLRKFGTPEIVVEAAVNTPNQSPRRLSEDELQAMQPFTYVPDDDRAQGKVP